MNIRKQVYRAYCNIYPKISSIRGTYRLKMKLQDWQISGVDIVDESDAESIFEAGDWDNILILDACRHDLMEETLGKDIPERISLNSRSYEFIQDTFSEGNYEDTVVITANPHYYDKLFREITGRDIDDVFHSVFHTYQTDWEKNTVLPENVIRDYKTAEKLFPEKRKIVHFMQPHNPFIGGSLDVDVDGFSKYMGAEDTTPENPKTEWDLAREGVITDSEVWKAYKETLELVLESIRENREEFKGKTVITADHGNFAGEQGYYDHPGNRREVPLRKVPWVDLDEI